MLFTHTHIRIHFFEILDNYFEINDFLKIIICFIKWLNPHRSKNSIKYSVMVLAHPVYIFSQRVTSISFANVIVDRHMRLIFFPRRGVINNLRPTASHNIVELTLSVSSRLWRHSSRERNSSSRKISIIQATSSYKIDEMIYIRGRILDLHAIIYPRKFAERNANLLGTSENLDIKDIRNQAS